MTEKKAKKFDFDEFRKTKYQKRLLIYELKNFGDTNETVEWEYTSLSSSAMAMIEVLSSEDALNKQKLLIDLFSKTTGSDSEQILEAMGLNEKVPMKAQQNYLIFEQGSVNLPKWWSRTNTVTFANAHPIEFTAIKNKIWEATCMGQEVKKKQTDSGKKTESETT